MKWGWGWETGGEVLITPQATDLQDCDGGPCCFAATVGSMTVTLAPCDGTKAQLWSTEGGKMMNTALELCVSTTGKLADCDTVSAWQSADGFYVSYETEQCLGVETGHSFCNFSVCPFSNAVNFTTGMPIAASNCTTGDRAAMFTTSLATTKKPNFQPVNWGVSAYIGNGEIGVRLQADTNETGTLLFTIDNVRLGALSKRQETGYFKVVTGVGALSEAVRVNLTVDLHTAVLTGDVVGMSGKLASFRGFVDANLTNSVFVLEYTNLADLPGFGISYVEVKKQDFNYSLVQSGQTSTLISRVGDSTTSAQIVDTAVRLGVAHLLAEHKQWWAEYWPESFISLPDTKLEAMYYVQMYRFASSDRVTLHGLMGAFGPTLEFNLWGDDTWDMNEQVMYWITYASNRPSLSAPMLEYVSQGRSLGDNTLWMFHSYMKQMKYEGRDLAAFLPKLVASVASFVGKHTTNTERLSLSKSDKKYHLASCKSPEYRCYPPFESMTCDIKTDCNYLLAQVRWGIAEAFSLAARSNVSLSDLGIQEPYWAALIGLNTTNPEYYPLTEYPTDPERGYKLSAECNFLCPHRHFSHLLMIYDLETVTNDNYGVMARSLDNWYSITCDKDNWFNEECRGFTQCGVAGMSAVLRRSDAAVNNLTNLVDSVILPNGMYGEQVWAGHPDDFSPVSESAYCGAGIMHMVLLHHRDGVLSVFPNTKSTWQNASFYRLRSEEGYTVSAAMQDRRTTFVQITSPNPIASLLEVKGWGSSVTPICDGCVVSFTEGETWRVVGNVGATVVTLHLGSPSTTILAPTGNITEYNYFGYNRAMSPIH